MIAAIKRRCLTFNSPLWRMIWKLRGIKIGSDIKFIGRPGLNRKRGSNIELGSHVVLCSNPIANPLCELGKCRLATLDSNARLIIKDRVGLSSATICCANSIIIGAGTQIGGGVLIMDTDFHPRKDDGSWATDPAAVSQPVVIGENCFIGARAIILKGVQIGDGAVIGAGSVVTNDIPPSTIACGNPAIVMRHINNA